VALPVAMLTRVSLDTEQAPDADAVDPPVVLSLLRLPPQPVKPTVTSAANASAPAILNLTVRSSPSCRVLPGSG